MTPIIGEFMPQPPVDIGCGRHKARRIRGQPARMPTNPPRPRSTQRRRSRIREGGPTVCADTVARHVPLTPLPTVQPRRRWLCAVTITQPSDSKVNQLRKYYNDVNLAGGVWRTAPNTSHRLGRSAHNRGSGRQRGTDDWVEPNRQIRVVSCRGAACLHPNTGPHRNRNPVGTVVDCGGRDRDSLVATAMIEFGILTIGQRRCASQIAEFTSPGRIF
jgi:hypothetical protein